MAKGADALREKLNSLATDGVAHVVVDAVANDDLGVIAAACRDMMLMTGGSAVAMPLPALYRKDGVLAGDAAAPVPPTLPEGAVILSGSCSAMTNEQVAAYRGGPSLRLDPIELASAGPDTALAWLAAQPRPAVHLWSMPPPPRRTCGPLSNSLAWRGRGPAETGESQHQTIPPISILVHPLGGRTLDGGPMFRLPVPATSRTLLSRFDACAGTL